MSIGRGGMSIGEGYVYMGERYVYRERWGGGIRPESREESEDRKKEE